MKVEITAHIVEKDAKGNIVREFDKPCNSFTRQFIDGLLGTFGGSQNAADVTNTQRGIALTSVQAPTGSDTYGIMVGTGTNAVTINDYALQTKILHGTTAGKLQYGNVSYANTVINGSTAKFTITRTFTNNSGADITVNEIALYIYGTWNFCIERTLMTFTVTNTNSSTVTYTVSVTV